MGVAVAVVLGKYRAPARPDVVKMSTGDGGEATGIGLDAPSEVAYCEATDGGANAGKTDHVEATLPAYTTRDPFVAVVTQSIKS